VTPKGRSRLMEAYAGGNIMVIFGYRNLERNSLKNDTFQNQGN
jgi:hypothetical protein